MLKRSVVQVAPLAFRAAVSPDTLDDVKRTVEVVWTTGARVLRGYYDQFWEELSLDPKHVRMDRLNGGAPLLDSHNGYGLEGVIGVVESARLEKGKGTATVRFARAEDDPTADAIFRKVKDGIIRNVSVGYRIHKMEKIKEEEGKIPVYRAVDWTPHEISMVPIGADAGAGVRSDNVITNPCEFIEERAMPDPIPETAPANPNPTPAPAPAPVISAEARAEITRLERERTEGIRGVARALGRPESEATDAIAKGTTLDAFRADAINAHAKAKPEEGGTIQFDRRGHQIEAGVDARDKFMRCAEHLIYQRAGVADLIVQHAKSRGETLVIDPGECRGLTMAELAREFLERSGVRTRGMDKLELVGKAFMQRSGGLNSTSDFSVLLENTLHKTLLAAYTTTPDTWRRFCKTGTVTDFRPHPRYRQGSFGVLETVNEAGEFKNAPIPDGEKQSISAGTKGRMIGITRQAIINDDMGAFNDLATRLGRAAALTIEVDVYALLVANPNMGDGVALFHANHGNIGAGGAAISVATIDADRVLMATQKDPSLNEVLELRPAILVLPVGLGGTARVINQAQYDVDKVANARNQEPNKVVGLYRDIVDTSRLAGTTRYSFADPSIAPVIEVVFLNGQQAPYMEMQQGWRTDGVEWKVRHDFGVGAIDWRGVVRNPGA
jgi:HK97 family phage prohead protease